MSKVPTAVWRFCGGDGWCYVDWADHWQTMITGCLAVGAAAWAASLARHQLRVGREQVAAAREQIQAQLDDEKDRRRRALRSARAVLPGVLTTVCDHAAFVAKSLHHAWPSEALSYPDDFVGDYERRITVNVPRFPDNVKAPLQDILVHVDDETVHERISSIFREAQVLDERTGRLAGGDAITLDWLSSLIVQAIALHVRATSLYTYSRGESETIDVDLWPNVFVTMAVLGVSSPPVKKWAERERANGFLLGEGDRLIPTIPAIEYDQPEVRAL